MTSLTIYCVHVPVGTGRLIKTGLAGLAGMNEGAVEKAYTYVLNHTKEIVGRMGSDTRVRQYCLDDGRKDLHVHIGDMKGLDQNVQFVESSIMVGLSAIVTGKRVVEGVGVLGAFDTLDSRLLPIGRFGDREVEMCRQAGLKTMILGGEEAKEVDYGHVKTVYVKSILDALPLMLVA